MKKPKTADGVLIGIGSTVFVSGYIDGTAETEHVVTALRPMEDGDWRLHDYYSVFASECYSTREAAEAAEGPDS